MRLIAFSLALFASTSVPAMAQDSTETLRQALSGMPEMLLTNPDPMQIFFLDVSAWRGLGAGEVNQETVMRLSIARNIAPLDVLNYRGLDNWDEKAGIPLSDISYLAGFGMPPSMVAYWGFDEAATGEQLMDTLRSREFVAVDGPVAGIFGNGEPNHHDLQAREPDNPWRGPLGRAHFVLPVGNAIIQAPVPEAMAALTEIEVSAADNAILATALDGLDGALGVEEGSIVQAMVISPAFGLEALDPASLIGAQTIEEARSSLEAAAQQNAEGIPPFFGGIIADIEVDNRPAIAVSLSYADCQSADQAVALLEARWTENMKSTAEISGHSVANAGSYCAAVVTFAGADEDQANPLLREMLDGVMTRQFNLLQIGMSAAQ